MNGYRNGGSGRGDVDGPAGCVLPWRVGLLNGRGRYLTAETFGFKINATGTALRKKQLWTIEYGRPTTADDAVLVRSHLGRYLAGDGRGNAACSSEEPTTDAERFVVECHPDGSGRWALRNRSTGLYFGGSDERLVCHEKQPGDDEWWTPHFVFPPQVTVSHSTTLSTSRWRGDATVRHLGLRSVGRGFKSCSRQRFVTTLGKLFTPMCLCHQAV